MPDATITSTASTFGTISGTFAADQSTIAGTITAITGTVNGSVGVPGPQGPAGSQGPQGPAGDPGAPGQGVAAGGSAGQVLQKLSATSYDTGWLTLPADYITSVTAPLAVASGNLSVNLSAYLPLAGGTITGDILSYNGSRFQTIASGSGSTYSLVASDGVVVSGGGVGGNQISIQWDGITFADGKQTVKYPGASILSGYATEYWVTAGFYPLTGNPSGFLTAASLSGYATESWVTSQGYITSAALTPYITSATATASFYPLTGNPSGFLTSAPVTSVAGRTGAITLSNTDISGLGSLAVVNDAPSDGSQYARKNAAWDVVIPGDRYLTTSTTSNTVSNGNKTFTIGTGLSYTPTQNITISYDASNHMHGEVLTYNSGTGVLTVDIKNHTGSGTYASWVVNVGGVTPATSVAWGAITGTLSSQTDLQNALDLKLDATTAASTYLPLAGGTMSGGIVVDGLGVYDNGLTVSNASYNTAISSDGIYFGNGNYISQDENQISLASSPVIHLNAGAIDATSGTNTLNIDGASVSIYSAGSNATILNATGITFPDSTVQTTAYTGGGGLITSVTYPLAVNSGDLSIDLAGYATESWVQSQGYLTSVPPPSLTGLTGDISWDPYAGTGRLLIEGVIETSPTFTQARLNFGSSTPTSPSNGDFWTDGTYFKYTLGAVTSNVASQSFVTGQGYITSSAVPAFATKAQARNSSNSTTTLAPDNSIWQHMSAAFLDMSRGAFNYTAAGTMGAVQSATLGTRILLGTAGACSGRIRVFGASQLDQSFSMMSKTTLYGINFSKPTWCSGRAWPDSTITDPNVTVGWYFGKAENSGTGDLARRGFGWEIIGNATTRYLTLAVHNGTTLTKVTSSYVVVAGTIFDWDVVSDGAGNVTLYVEGVSVATTALGPTGDTSYSGTRPVIWNEELRSTATTSAFSFVFSRGRIYMPL